MVDKVNKNDFESKDLVRRMAAIQNYQETLDMKVEQFNNVEEA